MGFDLNIFQTLPTFFLSNQEILWYAFLGMVVIFFFYSLFLVYHWFRYGMDIIASLLATAVYFSVSGYLIYRMFFFVTALI